jgi:hypothetical protein
MLRPMAEPRASAVSGKLCAGLGYDMELSNRFQGMLNVSEISLRNHAVAASCSLVKLYFDRDSLSNSDFRL